MANVNSMVADMYKRYEFRSENGWNDVYYNTWQFKPIQKHISDMQNWVTKIFVMGKIIIYLITKW